MSTLIGRLLVGAEFTLSNAMDLATGQVPLSFKEVYDLVNGTGVGQANLLWHDERTIAASGSELLDLAGVLADAFGSTITAAQIKGMIVKATAGNTNDVIIGGAASNGFASWVGAATDAVKVRPGFTFALMGSGTGYAVTAGTADQLQVANGGAGTSVTYRIVLVGASA